MTRASDLVRKTLVEKNDAVRLSDMEGFKYGPDTEAKSEQISTQLHRDEDEAENIYRSFQSFMAEVKECVIKNETVRFENALIPIRKLIDTQQMLEWIYPFTVATTINVEDYLIFHSVNVMVYSLKMGRHMGYPQSKLTELALSALLHDIGLFMIPDNVTTKKESLTESEISLVKRHPDMGKNLLGAFKEDCPWLLRAVYEHHEKENGQGYPEGIKGDMISEYAKIIGICDSYEAMTHSRPHRKAIMQFVSVRELVETKNFSNKILKAFLDELSLYPIGSYVKLNNKSIGRVIATNPDQPLKPIINLLFDGNGNRITEERIINLKENPILVVSGGIDKEEFPQSL